jgi:cation/acetate symporter
MNTNLGQFNPVAILFFLLFIALSLGITYWAANKTKNVSQFYTAGGQFTGLQNGLALAGDFLSASGFLGGVGLIALQGFDGLMYPIGCLAGWPILLFFVAEPLRNLGTYTFADVVAFRMRQKPVRIATTIGTLTVVGFSLIGQMVGAGNLIKLLFKLDYEMSLLIVGVVIIAYVIFGGMIATTWVQIIKTIFLLGGTLLMAILVLVKFGFNPLNIFAAVSSKYGTSVLGPSKQVANPLETVSVGFSFMFGTAGLPPILMRFYTVPDGKTARKSVMYACWFMGAFYLMTFVLGFSAMALLERVDIEKVDKGGNMAVPILADSLGGNVLLGFIAAVCFVTILAVVAGLTLSGAASLSHDIWVNVIRKGKADEDEQLQVARYATVTLMIFSILLSIVFKGQNLAYMGELVFTIAASANFPSLVLSIFWRGLTTNGTVASILVGTISCLFLLYLSPTIQIDFLNHASAIFPLKNPGLVTIPLSFLAAIVVSLLERDKRSYQKFDEVQQKIHLGNQHF